MIHPLASGFLRKKLLDAIPADDVVNKQRFVLFRIFSWSGTVVCIGTACKMLATIPEAGFLPWMILCLSLVMMVNYFAVQSFERLRLAYQVMLFSAFTLL
ncbi:MAG: hypothetical protein JNL88_00050, partial [Bacteroidia bacterium]|nr:hypothetical protein [Bacteroidia bacterium]